MAKGGREVRLTYDYENTEEINVTDGVLWLGELVYESGEVVVLEVFEDHAESQQWGRIGVQGYRVREWRAV